MSHATKVRVDIHEEVAGWPGPAPPGNPLDFRPFDSWRARADRARLGTKGTEIAASGQPTLKDKFKATFQMTLLGNALLARLWESHRYRVLAFPGGRGAGEVIEVYPGATLRHMGLAALQVAAAGSPPGSARAAPEQGRHAKKRKTCEPLARATGTESG
jgi:hypothetical protein